MKLKHFLGAFLLATGLISAGANAAYTSLVPPQANDGSIDLPPAGFTATYSPTAGVHSIWFDPSVSPQSPANVAASITAQFGGTLVSAGKDDSFSSGVINLPNNPFNVLAIHLGGAGGGNELLFFFNAPITSFNVTTFDQGGGNNLSNFRAWSGSGLIIPDPVPLPAAAWLFGSALIGLVGVARRKRAA